MIRKFTGYICISPKEEGFNIYLPGRGFDVYEHREDAERFWGKGSLIVKATVTYKEPTGYSGEVGYSGSDGYSGDIPKSRRK